MNALERRILVWFIGICLAIGLYVQVPRLLARADAQDAAYIAQVEKHTRLVVRDYRRAAEGIEAVNGGYKLQGGWR